ncbi:hypothetical protein SPLC1_S270710 [Arthrospira platensis C1]|nr:hypothetical protein SPLC1_S270710 [Arthrospira platensis C1]
MGKCGGIYMAFREGTEDLHHQINLVVVYLTPPMSPNFHQ